MGNAAAKEPSMEDILSSIRKIVSQEDEAADDGEEGVSDADPAISHDHERPVAPATSFAKLAHQARGKAAMAARREAPQPLPADLDDDAIDISAGLHAPETEYTDPGTADSAEFPNPQESEMNSLADSMAAEEMEHREAPAMSDDEDVMRQDHEFKEALVSSSTQQSVTDSFERMKRSVLENIDSRMDALMRPMLSSWLDQNLPGIVERIVREEVEKLAKVD